LLLCNWQICCHCHCDPSSFFSSVGNIEIITNSVVIVFICDLDELLYAILNFYPGWEKSFSKKNKLNLKVICLGRDDGREDGLDTIHGPMQSWKAKWQVLRRFEFSAAKT
jgi:hypothetical protein